MEKLIVDAIIFTRWLEFAGLGLFLLSMCILPFILSDDGRRLPPVDEKDK
tara:strand:- start:73 stop:222 length:150 start_codon:yes stop_codon:yes gene_type:complete